MVPSRTRSCAAVAGALLAVSCGGGGRDQPPPEQPEILLEDDFSDVSTGWLGEGEDRFEGENVDILIGPDVLQILVKAPEGRGGPDTTGVLGGSLEDLGDVSVEVDATVERLREGGFYALMCRLQDFDNFYGFAVVEGGSVSIFRIEDGVTEELAVASDVVVDETTTHRVRADCVGERLTMFLDGNEVLSAQDAALPSGAVGMMAETRAQQGYAVGFDNFVLREAGG